MSKREEYKRRGQNSGKRKKNKRHLRKRFLIVCEGERTEPNYFESFKVAKELCEIVGVGDNTLRLVREAISLKEKGNYDEVWVVMDKDDFPSDNFNNALNLARQKGVQVAYSNEAFEIWYLLHYHYHNAAISRSSYKERLTACLGFEYKKNIIGIYDVLMDKQSVAIQNAARLLASYGEYHNPAHDNPCTTVHLLVETLRNEEPK
ncbi:MAG TPA: RloB family protein [Anaerolineae bacterium]|nr:RloB family protein [Anaerolineae bacterium]